MYRQNACSAVCATSEQVQKLSKVPYVNDSRSQISPVLISAAGRGAHRYPGGGRGGRWTGSWRCAWGRCCRRPPGGARGEVDSGPPPRGDAVGLPPLLPPRLLGRLCWLRRGSVDRKPLRGGLPTPPPCQKNSERTNEDGGPTGTYRDARTRQLMAG